jgi:NhaP-type Na+/H+ or K+/H+ antiporter
VAVRRLVTIGALIAFGLGAIAAHWLAGLTWPSALVLGAIFVVTGPTVVLPLLRHARLRARTASLLRWEAILADPIGALLAVLVFEGVLVYNQALTPTELVVAVGSALVWALVGGYVLGQLLVRAFIRGYIPEFLKAPFVVGTVLVVYAVSDLLLEESGLLTVTVLGVTLGNSRIASLDELRRFKEVITILLVSALFIVLTASLEFADLAGLTPRDALFVAALLVIVRPVAVLAATVASGTPLPDRLLAAWIAPRGVVAVAVSGLFAIALGEQGVADADRLVPLTFAVVIVTVFLHGFSLAPLARLLGLGSAGPDGVLLVGASPWTTALADKLKAMEVPVLIADRNWNRLREARYQGIEVYYGEILSEPAEHHIELNLFGHLIAATDNDDYNALICSDFGPEFGRSNVLQLARHEDGNDRHALAVTLGGRPLLTKLGNLDALEAHLREGWVFRTTRLTGDFDAEDLATASEGTPVLALRGDRLLWLAIDSPPKLAEGDQVLSFGPGRD